MDWKAADIVDTPEYWAYVEKIVSMAEQLGLYMALLPSWGSLVKNHLITDENVCAYVDFLAERFAKYDNIIWALGGDIKADAYIPLYRKFGTYLKKKMPDKLITFHPFGRCASTMWFAEEDW